MRVGIVGYGLMGKRRHAHLGGDELIAIRDRNCRVDSVGSTMDRGDIDACDAIVVAVPTPNLVDVVLSLPDKPILLEKPCAMSAHELIRLEGRRITPGFTLRHYPGVVELRRLINEDVLGRIMYARMLYGHGGGLSRWRATTGHLLDMGSHLLDLTRFLFGPMVEVDWAQMASCVSQDSEDNVWMQLSASKCPTVTAHVSATEWHPWFLVEVMGSDGSAGVRGLGTDTYGAHILRAGGHCEEWLQCDYSAAFRQAHENEWRAFVEGRGPTFEDALAALQLIDRVRAKAEEES